MGWSFTYGQSRKSLIQELTSPFHPVAESGDEEGKDRYVQYIAHCTRGNILWGIRESTVHDKDGKLLSKIQYITCHLMQKSDGSWGYKGMDEAAHPYYYSCPVSYLDRTEKLVPKTPGGREWRTRVRFVSDMDRIMRTIQKDFEKGKLTWTEGRELVEAVSGGDRNELPFPNKWEQARKQQATGEEATV